MTTPDYRISDVLAALEQRVAELQRMIAFLRTIGRELRGPRGRPRIYGEAEERLVASLVAQNKSHRTIAKELDMPVASVGTLAQRSGAKRTDGNFQGGPRVKGVVDVGRKHVRVRP